jgi:selenocysteine lyase/cysteine desulfurase
VHAHDFTRIELTLKPTAARYEGGTQNMAGFLGLAASLELLLQLGIADIAERVLEITDFACERLKAIGANIVSSRTGDERSGIVSFEMPGQNPQALRDHLLSRGVALGCRAGRLRISPHAYVNEADVDRLVESLSHPH